MPEKHIFTQSTHVWKKDSDQIWSLPKNSYLTWPDILAGMLESQVSLNFELDRVILNYCISMKYVMVYCFLKAKIIYT